MIKLLTLALRHWQKIGLVVALVSLTGAAYLGAQKTIQSAMDRYCEADVYRAAYEEQKARTMVLRRAMEQQSEEQNDVAQIDENPQPSSPYMRSVFECLRARDAGGECMPVAGR